MEEAGGHRGLGESLSSTVALHARALGKWRLVVPCEAHPETKRPEMWFVPPVLPGQCVLIFDVLNTVPGL